MAFKSGMLAVVMLTTLVAVVHGYSTGSPPGACGDLVPQHKDTSPQKLSGVPYHLEVSPRRVRPGDDVTVIIRGKSNKDVIVGFLMQARHNGRVVGHFKTSPNDKFAQTLDCNDGKANSVTHRKHDEKLPTAITLTWEAPKDLKADIVFNSTIAINRETFWVGVESDVVSIK